jgi:hypothetical protein
MKPLKNKVRDLLGTQKVDSKSHSRIGYNLISEEEGLNEDESFQKR